jgi:protein-tyrosine-phosphatase
VAQVLFVCLHNAGRSQMSEIRGDIADRVVILMKTLDGPRG